MQQEIIKQCMPNHRFTFLLLASRAQLMVLRENHLHRLPTTGDQTGKVEAASPMAGVTNFSTIVVSNTAGPLLVQTRVQGTSYLTYADNGKCCWHVVSSAVLVPL